LRRREITSANKNHLAEAIRQLDKEKDEDIEKTIKEVDRNFRDIFSVLLPGASARLEKVFSEGELTGINLKVAFSGDTEKQSLSELSGGQRSLLALSLILALLKYQPAPFYVLDEIDSALDLSHTQNIGVMIRKYFASS